MRLDNDHASLAAQGAIILLLYIVVDFQMKVIILIEIAYDPDKVASFDPQLDGPATTQRHFEQNRTLDEAMQNWLPILIHRWT